MAAHARLSPSSAESWALCPGRVTACEGRQEEYSQAAIDGIGGHLAIAIELTGGKKIRDRLGSSERIEQDSETVGLCTFTEELVAACETCVKLVKARIQVYEAAGYEVVMHIEQRVYPGALFDPSRDDCWGTADVILLLMYQDRVQMVEVIDHKLGEAIAVSPESYQLRLYGLGAVGAWAGMHPEMWPAHGVRTTVLQPRHHLTQDAPASSVDWTREQMQEFLELIQERAVATDDENAPRIPGEKQCRWCAYRPHCKEAQDNALTQAIGIFSDLSPESTEQSVEGSQPEDEILGMANYLRSPAEVDLERLIKIKEAAPLIRAWLTSVEDHLHNLAVAGTEVPGWKLVYSRGRKTYTNEEEVRKLFQGAARTKAHGGTKLARDDYMVSQLISPAQAVKKLKPVLGAKTWKRIESCITTPKGSLALVPESDPREAARVTVDKVFSEVGSGMDSAPATEEKPSYLSMLD